MLLLRANTDDLEVVTGSAADIRTHLSPHAGGCGDAAGRAADSELRAARRDQHRDDHAAGRHQRPHLGPRLQRQGRHLVQQPRVAGHDAQDPDQRRHERRREVQWHAARGRVGGPHAGRKVPALRQQRRALSAEGDGDAVQPVRRGPGRGVRDRHLPHRLLHQVPRAAEGRHKVPAQVRRVQDRSGHGHADHHGARRDGGHYGRHRAQHAHVQRRHRQRGRGDVHRRGRVPHGGQRHERGSSRSRVSRSRAPRLRPDS